MIGIIEMDEKTNQFLNEFEELCKKHNRSIGHEDGQGAFEIHLFDQGYIDWVRDAIMRIDEKNNSR